LIPSRVGPLSGPRVALQESGRLGSASTVVADAVGSDLNLFCCCNDSRFTPNSDVGDELPAREAVLDIIGDLFAYGRQLKHLFFDHRIVSLLGKLPIPGCFVPKIVSPFHVVQSNEPGS